MGRLECAQEAGVGEWVEAMVRVEGNAVLVLGAALVGDWQLETGEDTRQLVQSGGLHRVRPAGKANGTVAPEQTRDLVDRFRNAW